MKRTLILALAAGATLLGAGVAQASDVRWSVGINLPPIATVVTGGPAFVPAPVYYPAPVVRYAEPVVYAAPTVVYRDPAFFYGVYGGPRFWGRPGFYPRHDVRWAPPIHVDDHRMHHDGRVDYRR